MTEKFQGTENYIATEDLRIAVNAALTLERPLLIKGEPGTGKTVCVNELFNDLDRDSKLKQEKRIFGWNTQP